MTRTWWTEQRERAALLLAADELSDEDVAREIGASRRQLARWKLRPEFVERVNAIVEGTRKALLRKGIADKRNRVNALNDRWSRMQRVIQAREEEHADVPGGDTGLLVRQVKLSANGREIPEYAVDTGLLKELRAHEEQAARELGEWTEKQELTGKDGLPLIKGYVVVSPDDWDGDPKP